MIHHFFFATMPGPPEIALLIPIAAMTLAGVIVVAGLIFKYHQRRLWHETARAALEKGQPLPPYPGEQAQDITKSRQKFAMSQMAAHHRCRRPRWRRDLRGGLVLLAIGLAVYFARPPEWTPGWNLAIYIPGFMGGALLLNALFNAIFAQKETETDTRPPQRDPS